jgi:hypothetical protein
MQGVVSQSLRDQGWRVAAAAAAAIAKRIRRRGLIYKMAQWTEPPSWPCCRSTATYRQRVSEPNIWGCSDRPHATRRPESDIDVLVERDLIRVA